ncbi:CPBP family intramembrane metalloprotease [Flavobacterium salilacus subsp. salilacus]|uniref:CPBP family intramembrane glutamic endopeptidase n=1 Tax=Flavobacterium TaxID=237 RepID=UPI001074ADFB|nr:MULTISPECIES: type II CAAX endopeptidase family protein [Flavobacterium]KAF2519193.1 CPBP family intramembrane metalloprotease [Flavobacterium salilacus subsp. salilacus]MBE1613373.1 CPBP family intramembrane metalloprotease [Flavobacterium sp. SaA2.13]
MFIKKAYSKDFDFVKYLPIPLVFLGLIVLNYVVIAVLNIDVEQLLREEIAKKGANRVFIEALLPMAVLLGILLLWVKYVQKQRITSLTTAREDVDWKRIWFSFGLWGGITVLLTGIAYVTGPENFEFNFKPIPFAILAVTAILMVPLQTSFEEYLFRGYLMQGIGIATRSRLIPLVVTSVCFGLMHIANPEVGKLGYILLLYYVGTGFFLGIITLMDDGIELALGFHAANNLISALLVTSDWTAFQTDSILKDMSEPSAGFDIFIPLVILYPILLVIFSRKYGWSNWKEKLTGRIQLTQD